MNSPQNAGVTGHWRVVADTSGRGDTGNLDLAADGTFKMIYATKGGSSDTADDTYSVAPSPDSPFGLGDTKVQITIKHSNGKPVPSTPPLTLYYDASKGRLQDLLTVAFVRASP